MGGHRLQGRAPRPRGGRLGVVRGPYPASALDRRGGDRLPGLRRSVAPNHRCRQPLARRRHRCLLDAQLGHGPGLLGGVVPGRLHHRVVPRPVPELVLRPADDVHRPDQPATDPHAPRPCPRPRRPRRGDAQEQGQCDLVRRRGRGDRCRRHALAVCRGEPDRERELRLRDRRGGGPPLPHPALEHLRLPGDVRAAGRLDAGSRRDRWGHSRPDRAGPMDPVPPGRAGVRGPRQPRRV